MKILRLYQIYMEIKGYTHALCYRFVVFSRSSAFLTPELFSFARDGAKGLGSRMAVSQTKWNEEKKVRPERGFFRRTLGTVHFLRGRGGWWVLGGGHRKKNGLKGGAM